MSHFTFIIKLSSLLSPNILSAYILLIADGDLVLYHFEPVVLNLSFPLSLHDFLHGWQI